MQYSLNSCYSERRETNFFRRKFTPYLLDIFLQMRQIASGGAHPPISTIKGAQKTCLECMSGVSMIKLKHDSHSQTWGLLQEPRTSKPP